MYENKTEDVLRDEMLSSITSPVSKIEGTFVWDALSPVANELAKEYMELDSILKKGFAQTSYGTWLEMRAGETGVFRKAGTKARASVLFTGTDGVLIVSGTTVQTIEGLQFKTLTDGVVTGGSISIIAEALEIGIAYNVAETLINTAPVGITGIATISNPAPATGGNELESDEALSVRLLLKVRNPAVSGNSNHYKQWAMEISGVGDAKIYPIWNGAGTVKVCLIDSNMLPVSQAILDNVKTHIDEEKPIGSTVTCVSATPLYIVTTVKVVLSGSLDLASVKSFIKTNLDNYFKSIAFKQSFVSYAKMMAIILSINGVADSTDLIINTLNKNIFVDTERVALLGTLTVTQS
jgi:uncharacterized phage protein gp47/JayE